MEKNINLTVKYVQKIYKGETLVFSLWDNSRIRALRTDKLN